MSDITNLTTDMAALVFEHGTELTVYVFSDYILNAMGANITEVHQGIPNIVANAVVANDDPFSYPWVHDWQNMFAVIYVTAGLCFVVFGGGIMVLTRKMGGQAHRTMNYLFADTVSDLSFKAWTHKLIMFVAFGLFATAGIWLILYISYIFSQILASEASTVIVFSPENVMVYFIMAMGYAFIGIFMMIRTLFIDLFVAGGLGIAILYLIPATEGIAELIIYRMVSIVFLQPILIFVAMVGLEIGKYTTLGTTAAYYMTLIVVMAWIAFKVIFGDFITRLVVNKTKQAASLAVMAL
jgi:hypothetical protein